ncbi:7-cyano-7-deazaguanine synthase [Plantactinospora sp. GCM10030261]|uniref:7-cyano-7-deazaguanine synthase n=1 Tax=Plantactinospora sp. GCM10030261 TaxID=3273420 RepID=UPI00361F3C57
MSAGQYAYEYADRSRLTGTTASGVLSNNMFRAADSAIERNLAPGSLPASWAEDLLQIARAVYLADKLSRRDACRDRWTRTIALSVQLVEPDRWRDHTEPILVAMLETLTSDRWDVRFRGGATSHRGVQGDLVLPPAQEVTLFSGGLDSTAYAAERSRLPGGPLLLLSYCHSRWRHQQEEISAGLRPVRDLRHLQVLEQTNLGGRKAEPTSRSRGLLYLATAIYVASSHNVAQVTIPENGQLAVNPPLTAARVAAASTRSVHPYFLHLINKLIGAVGGTVTVVNPLLPATKGEVCRRARDAGLTLATIMRTVSCGRPPWLYGGGDLDHCGRCYPCLLRRSGLLTGVGRDDTPYKADVLAPGVKRGQRADLLALRTWLANDFGIRDLAVDLPLPPQADAHALLETILRGRDELRHLIAQHGRPGTAA